MIFEVNEDLIVRLLIEYLKDRRLYDAMCVLQLETGINGMPLAKELNYLHRLVLEGRWVDVISYIKPFQNVVDSSNYKRVEYMVRRQYFLEILSSETGDIASVVKKQRKEPNDAESDAEVLAAVDILKSMENLCDHNEFLTLCMCVTLEHLCDSQDNDIASWSVSKGRIQCSEAMKELLHGVIPNPDGNDDKSAGSGEGGGLLRLLALALAQQTDVAGRSLPPMLPVSWKNGSLSPPDGFVSASAARVTHSLILSPEITKDSNASTRAVGSHMTFVDVPSKTALRQDQSKIIPKETASFLIPAVDDMQPVSVPRISTGPPISQTGNVRGRKDAPPVAPTTATPTEPASSRLPVSQERRATSVPRAVRSGARDAGGSAGADNSALSRWRSGRAEPPVEVFQSGSPIRALVVLPSRPPAHQTEARMVSVAIGSNDRALRTLRLTAGFEVLQEWRDLHRGSLFALTSTAATGITIIASGSNDKTIRITRLDRSDSGSTSDTCLKGHNGTVRALQFNCDQQEQSGASPLFLASGGAGDCAVRLWDVATASVALCIRQDQEDSAPAAVHGLCWLDGLVAAAGEDGRINCFDPRTGSRVWTHSVHSGSSAGGLCSMVKYADKTGGGGLLLTGHTDGTISLVSTWDRRTLLSRRLHGDEVRSVAIQSGVRGGLEVLTASSDGTAGVWSVSKSSQTSTWEAALLCKLVGHTDKVLNASFVSGLRDSETVVTSGADGRVLLWSPAL